MAQSQQITSLYAQACGPSGHEHAVSLRLTPSCLVSAPRLKVIRNLVLAKGNALQVYDVCVETTKPQVNGHVNGIADEPAQKTTLIHLREHLLHGIVTGLERIRIIDSDQDGLHRLLVAFRDAKMAILEWSSEINDLVPVSLHSYERLPQIAPILGDGAPGHPLLRADQASRCAAILLPAAINTSALGTLAILPLMRDSLDNVGVEEDKELADLHYAPSYTIDLAAVIDPKIARVQDFCFLPGFTEPTLAVLFQSTGTQTWTGRLENSRDSFGLVLLTLASATPTVILDCPHPLPYSCTRIFPCPPQLGGVIILTADACIHVDQSAKVTGCAANGWHKRSSALALPSSETPNIALEGAQLVFLAPTLALVVIRSGEAYTLSMERDGRSLSAIRLSDQPVVQTVAPSSLEVVGREFLFVASAVGDSVLLRWTLEGGDGEQDRDGRQEEQEMDVDVFDAALYGESTNESSKATDLKLAIADSLPAYGSIRSMAIGVVEAEEGPELVAATGGLQAGRLTALHRGVPPRKRRKLDIDFSSSSTLHTVAFSDSEDVVIASDLASTQMYRSSAGGGLVFEHSEAYGILGASSFLDNSRICCVTSDRIHLLHPDFTSAGASLHIPSKPPIERVTFAESYLLLTRKDGSLAVYAGDDTVIAKTPLKGVGKATYVGACLFADSLDQFPVYAPSSAPVSPVKPKAADAMVVDDEDAALYATDAKRATTGPATRFPAQRVASSLVVDDAFERRSQYLVRISAEGVLELVSLPGCRVVFSAEGVLDLPDTIVDGAQAEAKAEREEGDEPAAEPPVIEAFLLASMGQTRKRPHLLILLDNGLLVGYEVLPELLVPFRRAKSGLHVRFVKVLAHRLDPAVADDSARQLTPFTLRGIAGVFVTGACPAWLLAPDRGPLRAFASQVRDVISFTALPHSTSDYLVATSDGISRFELPDLHYDRPIPWTGVVDGKPYSHVVYDPPSQTYVCAGSYASPFCLFDEEGAPVWEPDASDLLGPETLRSSVELVVPGTFDVIDGYEFRENESVLSLVSVEVNTHSTATGKRQYVCAGTIVNKGEDSTAKGAIYMFEVVAFENVGEGLNGERIEAEPKHWNRKLVLRFMEDLKSGIGVVGAVSGYGFHSMGQKIFVKRWLDDERLLPVGFADVSFHTTVIASLKNFLLVGDQVRGLSFYGYQEDPYKIILLGKETRCGTVSTADFLVHDERVDFVITDPKGVVRILEYNPYHVESNAGQKLLLRTEFQTSSEISSTVTFGRRSDLDSTAQQSGILLAGVDGSLSTLLPVRDPVYRRLSNLERQLQRHAPNRPAGLNHRAFRSVRNDFVSRALTKGVLDGPLLDKLVRLPLDRQLELAERAGTDPDTVALNMGNVKNPWS